MGRNSKDMLKTRTLLRNISTRSFALLVALPIIVVLAWASNEPWKGKPYEQWDDKDVQRVFTDSPWARKTTVTRTWRPLAARDLPEGSSQGTYSKMPSEVSDSKEGIIGDEVNFNVYWDSSRVMRAASARQGVLHGGNKDVDVDKYANEPQDEYQIVLQANDMTPFIRKTEKVFQDNAFLQMRKTRAKVSPSHVRYEHYKDERIVTAAVFFFPKKTPSGDPTIASDEKSVEFNCKIEGSTLRVTFEPPKMVDQQGPSL